MDKARILGVVVFFFIACASQFQEKVPKEPEGTSGYPLSYYKGVDELTSQLITSITAKNKESVAVVDFQNLDGSRSLFGIFLAEKLISGLFKGSLPLLGNSS